MDKISDCGLGHGAGVVLEDVGDHEIDERVSSEIIIICFGIRILWEDILCAQCDIFGGLCPFCEERGNHI